jgi:hypothetical protein
MTFRPRSPVTPLAGISRRHFVGAAALCAVYPWLRAAGQSAPASKLVLPPSVPSGVAAIIAQTLKRLPDSVNTDWFGTCLMEGLLRWHQRGVGESRAFAEAWFDYHSHQETITQFQGPKSRIFRAGGVPVSTYAGHYGLAMPCYQMATQFGHAGARRTCIDLAGIIAREAHRNRFGLIEHDDTGAFAIPDACYFVVTPLMMAAELDPQQRDFFRGLAIDQLRRYTDIFLNKETALAKTMLLPDGLGQTYWTRASGWLLWAMTSVLRYLEPSDSRRTDIIRDLRTLAGGVRRRQDASGGLRVLLDDPTTPLETTGTAMWASGVQESLRLGWLGGDYEEPVNLAWTFVKAHITPDGRIVQAFTGWAGPAEERRMVIDHQNQEWIPGFILRVSDELTRL